MSRRNKGKQEKKEIKKEVKKELARPRRNANRVRREYVFNPAGKVRSNQQKSLGNNGLSNLDKQLIGGMKNGIGATLREEPTAANWPKVYMNPFLSIDARLPIWPVRSTLCQFRQQTIKGQCNEKGNGWISFWPSNMICNDFDYATYTNAPGDSNEINGSWSGNAVCLGQFTKAQFIGDKSFSMRVVAWGFKIRFLGSELNKGGEVVFLQMMPRASMDAMDSTSMRAGYLDWKEGKFDNNWKQFNRLYTENDDGLYQNIIMTGEGGTLPQWSYDDFGNANTENFNYISATINAAAANQPFEVSVAGHFEMIGPLNNQTGVTSTTLNTNKHEKVVSKMAKLRTVDTQMKPAKSWLGSIADGAALIGAFL